MKPGENAKVALRRYAVAFVEANATIAGCREWIDLVRERFAKGR